MIFNYAFFIRAAYPWTDAFGEKSEALISWLYLTDVQHPQHQNMLLGQLDIFVKKGT